MRILVAGAGVIGCELAHELIRTGNDVTLLARNGWKDTLSRRGMVIRHVLQLHTTTDHPAVVAELKPEDRYDLIFTVMQYTQMGSILPILARNASRYMVLVGNNPDAEAMEKQLKRGDYPHEVAFGFQGTAGRQEKERVVSIHIRKAGMTVGALNGNLTPAFEKTLLAAAGDGYRITLENRMDAWLKCHLALVLPICYVCYAVGGRLPRATPAQLNAAIDAMTEGNRMLKTLGYPIRPENTQETFINRRATVYRMLRGMALTPLGRLAASDHAMRAVAEMAALDRAFEALRAQADLPMPNWEGLRSAARAPVDQGCAQAGFAAGSQRL